jgi:hypothetical protein
MKTAAKAESVFLYLARLRQFHGRDTRAEAGCDCSLAAEQRLQLPRIPGKSVILKPLFWRARSNQVAPPVAY